jgi:hypothetical protein
MHDILELETIQTKFKLLQHFMCQKCVFIILMDIAVKKELNRTGFMNFG